MPLRPLAASILIFIILIVGVYEIYIRFQAKNSVYRVAPNQKWIGVVDMNADHGIDMNGIIRGDDAILLLDYANPALLQLVASYQQANPLLQLNEFEISDYDSNGDGILDAQDPIFSFLHLLFFDPNGQGYLIKNLRESGIRGIQIQHGPLNNHKVIMSDGSTRTFYEIKKAGGTSIYRNATTKEVRDLPEISPITKP